MAKMEKKKVEDRFFKLYTQKMGCTQIWVDRDTKVQYLWHGEGYGGGLTLLVDAEGKPLLYKEAPNAPEY
jgi:hypothetical protein